MTIRPSLVSICQHAWSNDHPLEVRPRDYPLLPRLVPEIEGQYHWDDKKREVQTHAPGTVSDTERSLADEALSPVSLHGAQDVSSSFRQNTSWIEEPLVAHGGKDR